jgi:hypothetical protein
MKVLFFVIIATLMPFSPAFAQDAIPILRSSVSSGSERLALYSYTEFLKKSPSVRTLNIVNNQMQRLAFPIIDNGQPQTGIILRQGSLAPILSYDDNINGGNRNSSFELGGFVFEGAPATIAKQGIVLGGEVGGTLRYAYGRGRYLDVSGGLSAVYSPEYSLLKYAASASVCSKNHVKGWTFVDFCASAGGQKTDLSDSVGYAASMSVTQLFSLGGYDHQIEGSLKQNYFEDYNQFQFGGALTTSLGNPGSFTVGFGLGEDVNGKLHLNNRVYVGYNTSLFERPMSFQIERAVYDGGTFFGQNRVDKTLVLSMRSQISKQMTLSINARRNDSTIDFYKSDTIGFSFGFTGFQF